MFPQTRIAGTPISTGYASISINGIDTPIRDRLTPPG
jgi:hypothetical protein